MGPRFRVSSERLEKPGIEPTTPVLEGEQLHHYVTEASLRVLVRVFRLLTFYNSCLFQMPIGVCFAENPVLVNAIKMCVRYCT